MGKDDAVVLATGGVRATLSVLLLGDQYPSQHERPAAFVGGAGPEGVAFKHKGGAMRRQSVADISTSVARIHGLPVGPETDDHVAASNHRGGSNFPQTGSLFDAWGSGPASTPEPGTSLLACIGGTMLLMRRRW